MTARDRLWAVIFVVLSVVALLVLRRKPGTPGWHGMLEGNSLVFTIFVLIAILVGGIAELVPTIFVSKAVPKTGAEQQPYTALELSGRDIYVAEGCYTCHSQQIRPFRSEKLRYGEPSRAEEFQYDYPFQWGSKRTGPDLARVGGKYPDLWHYNHMINPRSTSAGSNMPNFPWLAEEKIDVKNVDDKLELMAKLGVPYSAEEIESAPVAYEKQAREIVSRLADGGVTDAQWDSKLVALIGYLQRLGQNTAPAAPAEGLDVTASAAEVN